MSQEVFAARTGYIRSYISLVENGRHAPSQDAILLFARTLNTTAEKLLKGIS
jgi:transcriptional regulator with XRE-family HTH domain